MMGAHTRVPLRHTWTTASACSRCGSNIHMIDNDYSIGVRSKPILARPLLPRHSLTIRHVNSARLVRTSEASHSRLHRTRVSPVSATDVLVWHGFDHGLLDQLAMRNLVGYVRSENFVSPDPRVEQRRSYLPRPMD